MQYWRTCAPSDRTAYIAQRRYEKYSTGGVERKTKLFSGVILTVCSDSPVGGIKQSWLGVKN